MPKPTVEQNTILLVVLDNSVPNDMQKCLLEYHVAFYAPFKVKLIKPGNEWKKVKLTKTFFDDKKIRRRQYCEDEPEQVNSSDIIKYLKDFKSPETFCVLGVTCKDLYPRDEWSFVFGVANFSTACGVFSFARNSPDFPGNEHYEINWLSSSY